MRDIAKGAIHFRHLISFASGFVGVDHRQLLLSDLSWEDFLARARIIEVKTAEDESSGFRPDLYLILDDRMFYRARYPKRALDNFRIDWANFQRLKRHAREAIVDALLEDSEARRFPMLKYIEKPIDEYLSEKSSAVQSDLAEQS